jgi:hypothetical protein
MSDIVPGWKARKECRQTMQVETSAIMHMLKSAHTQKITIPFVIIQEQLDPQEYYRGT